MFYPLRLLALIVITVVLSTLVIVLGLFDRHGKRVWAINQFWTWLILKIGGIRLKVHGLDQLDPAQPYLFVVNHQSNIDIPVLVQALPMFQLRWIAKKELLWVPFFGWAMWATKHITVDREDAADALRSLETAKQRLAAGISIVIFPEGTRSADGQLLPFKRGGFLLALKTKTTIVPLTINGSGKILPKGSFHLHPGEVSISVGAPLVPEQFAPGGLRGLTAQVQALVAQNLAPMPPAASMAGKSAVGEIAAEGRIV
jgi:1-acyl-sn-glycerol-3-phosphate acyltransferase